MGVLYFIELRITNYFDYPSYHLIYFQADQFLIRNS
jgi:hypothetical protein